MHADVGQVLVGSLSRMTGQSMQMDDILPDWLEKGVETTLRDSEYDVPVIIPTTSPAAAVVLTETRDENVVNKGGFTDLDSFYADPEELSEEEVEEESSEEESEDESGENDDDVIHTLV